MAIGQVPAKNEIMFVWFNRYAGVTIKTPTKTLVIDPVDVKPKNLVNVDAVLISHEHYDHLDLSIVSELYRINQCIVVADSTSAKRLRNKVPAEKLREVQPGSEVKIGEVSVRAEECNHPPAATPVTFIITSEYGIKVFHTADSLPYPGMASLGKKENFDLVFCTVGIAPGASPETGFEIARLTKPRVTVPYHTAASAELKKFAELVKKELPETTCVVPEAGKVYSVTKKV
ncbi:MAG: MBL fold metallo-hydrolase [Candidatus Bathyarchaeota archaeon]|nr:MBL fold metallo-hydrolase [Candidatus Bathyarchaeota archaeon]MCX8176954.1 MBL fold metallo-hydrolase [Candidatus Bathyarchaeota archaeon]MDW8193359.1 MBL fold metallo-hydrolase [Nitrososphaerota archaeon]